MIKLTDKIRKDTIKSLVRWRLSDKYWNGGFESLVEDLSTCSDHKVSASEVLEAMHVIIRSEPHFAERALRLAMDAQRLFIERKSQRNKTWLKAITKISDPNILKATHTNWLKVRIGASRAAR